MTAPFPADGMELTHILVVSRSRPFAGLLSGRPRRIAVPGVRRLLGRLLVPGRLAAARHGWRTDRRQARRDVRGSFRPEPRQPQHDHPRTRTAPRPTRRSSVAEEGSHLPLRRDRWREERRATTDERLVRRGAVRYADGHAVADAARVGGAANVTSGLSAVGPPPVTSSSQAPWNEKTAEEPPYSRYSVAPSTSR